MRLEPGHFYKSKAGDVWCCYRVDMGAVESTQAFCVRASNRSQKVDHFFLDGRYDSDGKREHCLVEECGPNGESLASAGSVARSKMMNVGFEKLYGGAFAQLDELCEEANRIAVEHGFTDATLGEDLMLMVTELAEAMEDVRASEEPTKMWYEERHVNEEVHKYSPMFGGARPTSTTTTTVLKYDNMDGTHPVSGNKMLRKPCGIPSELADVIIRIAHFCGKHKVPLARAVREKMAYNESRPFKHGGKKV